MNITVTHFQDYGISLRMVSGQPTAEEFIEYFLSAEAQPRWLCHIASETDMSGFDIAHLPELKRTIAAKDKVACAAVVCESPECAQFVELWRRYAEAGEGRFRVPVVFSSLKAACEWLDLPDEAHIAFSNAVGESVGATDPRRRSPEACGRTSGP